MTVFGQPSPGASTPVPADRRRSAYLQISHSIAFRGLLRRFFSDARDSPVPMAIGLTAFSTSPGIVSNLKRHGSLSPRDRTRW
jgi:hypothetical protein